MRSGGLRARAALSLFVIGISIRARAADPDTILVEVRSGVERIEQRGAAGAFADGWGTGLIAGPSLVALVNDQMSRSAGASGGLLARINAVNEEIQAKRFARRGDWARLIALLRPIHDDLGEHVFSIATDPATRDAVFDSMVLLGWAYFGSQDTEAAVALSSELVRSFPDREVTESMRGPAFQRFHAAVAAADRARKKVALRVEGPPANCGVYLNEFNLRDVSRKGERRPGAPPQRLLSPGRYRVFVDCGGVRHGRVHEVNLAGDYTEPVNLELDTTLQTDAGAVVLSFRDETARRANEVRYAGVIGRALRARRVVTLGVRTDAQSNLPALVARLIDPASDLEVASHSVIVQAGAPPSLLETRELADKLRRRVAPIAVGAPISTVPSEKIVEPAADAPPSPSPERPAVAPVPSGRRRDYRALSGAAIVVGAASAAVGVFLFYHEQCNLEAAYASGDCRPESAGRWGSVLTLATGAFAITGGLLALLTPPIANAASRSNSYGVTLAPTPTGVQATFAVSF